MEKDLTNRLGYIYKIISPNGKIYIGQTINLINRKSAYKNNHFKTQIKLWNNCQKYNWNPIDTFEIIEKCLCGINSSFINEKEIYWINFYNSFNNGLNCSEGGKCNRGRIVSEETRKKLKIASTGKKHSLETKKRISNGNNGKIRSKETKDKLKKINTGKKHSEETRKKLKIASTGKKHSLETKNKIAIKKIGNNWNIGIKRSEETKEKMSLSKSKKIKCLNNNKIYNSLTEAAKELNLSTTRISSVCKKKEKDTKGYIFNYE